MRFPADESCHFAIVRAFRGAGHDVLAVAKVALGAPDPVVIELARHEARILLTEDRDFGRLIFAHARRASGVVYLRYPAPARSAVTEAALALVADRGSNLGKAFVVVQPGRIRLTRRPGA